MSQELIGYPMATLYVLGVFGFIGLVVAGRIYAPSWSWLEVALGIALIIGFTLLVIYAVAATPV